MMCIIMYTYPKNWSISGQPLILSSTAELEYLHNNIYKLNLKQFY